MSSQKPVHAVGIYRASIRVSLNGDISSALRGKLKKAAFDPNGFLNDPGGHGTGAWINSNCTPQEMEACLSALWSTANAHPGPGKIDHIWSNFELIDLRSFFKSLNKKDRKNDALSSFLDEYGISPKSKRKPK